MFKSYESLKSSKKSQVRINLELVPTDAKHDCWYMNSQYVQSLLDDARWYKLQRSP